MGLKSLCATHGFRDTGPPTRKEWKTVVVKTEKGTEGKDQGSLGMPGRVYS